MFKELKANNVTVLENVNVVEVKSSGVLLDDGCHVDATFVVGAAGATPHAWLRSTNLKLHNGFVVVDDTLQTSEPNVFAVGDCAHMAFDPRPKAGVYAVRQAPVLLENLKRSLSSSELETYKPQKDYLKLVSLGGKRAFGEKNGLSMSGRIVWQVKNYIDKKFMKQFRQY